MVLGRTVQMVILPSGDIKLHFYQEGTYTNEFHGGALMLIESKLNPAAYEPGNTDAEIHTVVYTSTS